MGKTITLKDGQEIVLRQMRTEDVDRSLAFFKGLPGEDRKYLRKDVTRRDVVEWRIREIERGHVVRMIGETADAIVADGSLELDGHGWGDNVAEIRLIVARSYQRLGLGTRLARELYFLAARHRVDRMVARMMRPQRGARSILRKLGFHEEFLIPEHVRDQDGHWQDMIIMRCNLEDLWREMENLVDDMDWQGRWPRQAP